MVVILFAVGDSRFFFYRMYDIRNDILAFFFYYKMSLLVVILANLFILICI